MMTPSGRLNSTVPSPIAAKDFDTTFQYTETNAQLPLKFNQVKNNFQPNALLGDNDIYKLFKPAPKQPLPYGRAGFNESYL